MNTGTPNLEAVIKGLGTAYPVPPFRVAERTVEYRATSARDRAPAAELGLEWNGQRQQFKVEYTKLATPKQIELVLSQLRWRAPAPETAPLLIAPFFSAEAINRLVAQGVSAIDCSGNFGIVVPGQWLVMRTGAPNKYPSSVRLKNVYRGKSALVARALLRQGSFESATAIKNYLKAASNVSDSTISKVLMQLEEDLIVDRSEGVRLMQPDVLLDRLLANFARPTATRSAEVALDAPSVTTYIAAAAANTKVRYAVDSSAPYAVMPSVDPVTRVYVSDMDAVLANARVDWTSRFPNLELIETSDPAAYLDATVQDGVRYISPIQAYLELASGGKREQQAAEPLRRDILGFNYR